MDEMERDLSMDRENTGNTCNICWDKMLGVSILGGIATGLLYYIFCQLSEEQKQELKNMVVSNGKPMMAKLFAPKDDRY